MEVVDEIRICGEVILSAESGRALLNWQIEVNADLCCRSEGALLFYRGSATSLEQLKSCCVKTKMLKRARSCWKAVCNCLILDVNGHLVEIRSAYRLSWQLVVTFVS